MTEEEKIDSFQWVEGVQKDLVSILLQDRDFLVCTLPLVKPYYFQRSLYRELVEIAQGYFEKYHEMPTVAILQEATRLKHQSDPSVDRLIEEVGLLCIPTKALQDSKEYMRAQVVEFAKIQAMKSAIIQSAEELKTSKDYAKIEALIREALLITPDVNLGQDYFKDLKERFSRELASQESDRFTTGFDSIDKELGGGLGRKELGMIYAPPGTGKSIWLVKVGAENLKKGKKVLYFSMEMSEDRLAARFDSVLGLIPSNDRLAKFAVLSKRLEEIRKITGDNLRLKEFPTGSADTNTIRSYLVSLYNFTGWKPDIICLDYADLMAPVSGQGLEVWQRQQRIYEEVRGFASEQNLCVFTASQTNRMAKQVNIITDNELGDSYGKVRVVDVAYSINCTLEERVHSCGRIFVVKHRNGRGQYIVPIAFDFPTQRMREITQEQYDNLMKGAAEAPPEISKPAEPEAK